MPTTNCASVQLLGWGTALPPFFVTQEQAASAASRLWGEAFDRENAIRALYRRSGVQTRHIAVLERQIDIDMPQQSFFTTAAGPDDFGPTTAARMNRYDQEAPKLAHEACSQALAEANIDSASIKHLVTVSCSGFCAPGVDLGLIESLKLNANVTRTNVGFMGCHGALNGLRTARALAAQDPAAQVLLCCVELCTLHLQYTANTEELVANSLFSDGSAAVVLGCTQRADCWTLADQHSEVIPNTSSHMSWKIGDNGFKMTLSAEIPSVIESTLRASISAWLATHDLTINDIGAWAIHPGGPRILTASADALGIDRGQLETSQKILARCGNMSSPTILFILNELRHQPASRPCVALAFGPGLTIEAALLR